MDSAATMDGTPVRKSTMNVVSLPSRVPPPHSTRYTATITPIGIEMSAQTAPCSSVPTMAWYTPPPALNAVIPDCELVNHVGDVMAAKPFVITENSTHSSGTNAISTDAETNTVAALLA